MILNCSSASYRERIKNLEETLPQSHVITWTRLAGKCKTIIAENSQWDPDGCTVHAKFFYRQLY